MCIGEVSKEVYIILMVNCDEYFESGKFLFFKNIFDGDVIFRGENDV